VCAAGGGAGALVCGGGEWLSVSSGFAVAACKRSTRTAATARVEATPCNH